MIPGIRLLLGHQTTNGLIRGGKFHQKSCLCSASSLLSLKEQEPQTEEAHVVGAHAGAGVGDLQLVWWTLFFRFSI